MAELKVLRVVIASPGDVQAEREIVTAALEDINRSVAADRGLRLEPMIWETDAYPGFHPEGPQGLIDDILHPEDCDLLVGIFWKRFGTPTNDAGSGTEHEFRLAYESWRTHLRPQIMMYFSRAPHTPESKAETDQWGAVLEFRRTFPSEGLWWAYDGPEAFEALARNHITNWVRQTFPLREKKEAAQSSGSQEAGDPFETVQQELIAVQQRLFVGRQEVLRAATQFMETEKRGYFILRAGPGQGKTAVSCQLIRFEPSVYHFIGRTSGRSDSARILYSLVSQLKKIDAGLKFLSGSIDGLTRQYWESLKRLGAKSRILVVIDALDELPETSGQLDTPYLLTEALPEGVFFSVTSRPGKNLEQLEQDLYNQPHVTRSLEPLTPAEIADLFRALRSELPPEEIERVAEASQGNPLYLRAVSDELRSNPQFDLKRLPRSIEGFFRKAVPGVTPGSTLGNVLGILAAARTSLSIEDLSSITGMPQRAVYMQGIRPIEQFLLRNNDRHTFYHARFHDFVTQKVLYGDELRQAHGAIANWLLLGEMRSHPYRFAALAYHLSEAGERKKLTELIDKEFVSSKTRRMGYAVLEDLELVSQALLASGDPQLLDRCTSLLDSVDWEYKHSIASRLSRGPQGGRSTGESSRDRIMEPVIPTAPGFDLYAAVLPKAYAPADFVEVVAADNRVSLAIGDAPSFGIQSAFVARFVANVFRLCVEEYPNRTMSEVLSDIDRRLHQRSQFERISMQCISIDVRQRVATLASAGHPYPVHYSARRKKCDILPIRGELLQQIAGAELRSSDYQEYLLDVDHGDVIVMITDGLTESHIWRGEPYGYSFTSLIEKHAGEGAKSIADAILHDWASRERAARAGDDVTILVAVIQDVYERGSFSEH